MDMRKWVKTHFEEYKNPDSSLLQRELGLFILPFLIGMGINEAGYFTEKIGYHAIIFISSILFGTSGLFTMIREIKFMTWRGRTLNRIEHDFFGFIYMLVGFLFALGSLKEIIFLLL